MKKREICFISFYFFMLILIFLNFGIHLFRTAKFNKEQRTLGYKQVENNCNFVIHPRTGTADSWFKRDVNVNGTVCTLRGSTFDGVFSNNSDCDINNWGLRINIEQACYLNNAWCGSLEIHQKGVTQTLDLRNLNAGNVKLRAFYVDQDFMIPLEKGDYIIYHPSVKDKEFPVHAGNGYGYPGTITIGFIFYTGENDTLEFTNYEAVYNFNKSYFQGKEPLVFMIMLTLWIILLIVQITFTLIYRKVQKDAEHRLNIQRMEDIKAYNEKLNRDVEIKTAHIKDIQQKVVIGLANVIGNRDPDTGGHVKRTSDVIKIIVEEFRKQNPGLISDEKAKDIVRAAPMHDLGKISIDSSILCKPGKLTDEEFAIMKTHSSKSGEIVKLILKDVEEPHFVETAFNVARYHHERWDGKGYPDHLTGEAIPLEARIMSVADVYDALVSRRCYKQSMSFDKAYEIMCEGMGSQFDPQMKSVFIACRAQLENYYTLHE